VFSVRVLERYELRCGGYHLTEYASEDAVPLHEYKRQIYEVAREKVYDGMPKSELYRMLTDAFDLSPEDAEGMIEELKDAIGMYCPDGEHLRMVG